MIPYPHQCFLWREEFYPQKHLLTKHWQHREHIFLHCPGHCDLQSASLQRLPCSPHPVCCQSPQLHLWTAAVIRIENSSQYVNRCTIYVCHHYLNGHCKDEPELTFIKVQLYSSSHSYHKFLIIHPLRANALPALIPFI